jgi:Mlc titration factor MtfA (ptsG expression regulator)
VLFARWLNGWKALREKRILAKRAIPETLWQLTLARFPFLQQRSRSDLDRLRRLATLFLAEKEFTGAHGLQVTDEIAVAIAAQACLPILHLGLVYYDSFVGIVVHPAAAVARREVTDPLGVVHRYDETLAGEAMDGGPVMLSWPDVAQAGETAQWGYNVVIHEFAHVLDMSQGHARHAPVLKSQRARVAWAQALNREYQRFCNEVDAGHSTLLDPYGAESPIEFFAVAAEVFFVLPLDMQEVHPALYGLLRSFFRQDPAAFGQAH